MKWLNYHHLYYFHTIAQEGSIARAAEKLRLGQPTLSTQLKQLEDSLGQVLFERRNRRLVLTEAGHMALQYSQEMFRLGDEMVEVLQDRLVRNRVHLQIGALDSVSKDAVVSLVFQAYKLGNCSISILEGKGDELMRELHAHHLDLLVANYPSPPGDKNRLFSRRLARHNVVICAAPSFVDLKKNFPASLSGQPFILPTSHSKLRADLEHFFRLNQIQVDVVAETQDTGIQRLMGQAGVGLIPISEFGAKDLVREKKLIVLGALPNVGEDVWLISASRKLENPIASKLMQTAEL